MSANEAVILAAGRGSRLETLTVDRPKCLVQVCGRSILDWALDHLHQAGIHSATVVGGYRGEYLRRPGIGYLENARWNETNMVASLLCADGILSERECIVSYSDILFAPDTVRLLNQCTGDIAITYDRQWRALWEARFEDPLIDAECFKQENGKLIEIGGRATDISVIEGQYMGLLKFTPTGWRSCRVFLERLTQQQRDKLDMTGMLAALLRYGIQIDVCGVDGAWFEVDSPSDLGLAEAFCRSKDAHQTHDWRAC